MGNNIDRSVPQIGETYRHFKGGIYKILLISHCSETGQELISYQDISGKGNIWTRPLQMFLGIIGETTQFYRFEKISEPNLVIELGK